MNRPHPRERRQIVVAHRQRERQLRTVVVGCVAASVVVFALVAQARDAETGAPPEAQVEGGSPAGDAQPAALVAAGESETTAPAAAAPTSEPTTDESLPDLAVAEDGGLTEDCTIEPETITQDSDSLDVQCLQQALQREGFYTGELTGEFDGATSAAVKALQEERDLFVDGVAGRETGIELGVWPEEQLLVVRTPPPPPGAKDSLGFPLSSVASTAENAPPLPENSGSGYRVVYERISQRVWAVDDNEQVVRSWLVAGSQYNNEYPGTYQIYSRSEQSTAWNGAAILPYMIRWRQTEIGHIGFHGIPVHVSDGSPYMTEAELGTRLSGGCQRQANADALFLWNFAPVGTTVVVL